MPPSTENRKIYIAVYCRDKKGEHAQKERERLLEEHLNYVKTIADKVAFAGPVFGDDCKTIVGSLLIYNSDDLEKARGWFQGDPYYSADIWDVAHINFMRGAMGSLIGGIQF